ncbi:MAG: calcium/sodium antiporter [Wenzhouxiangella sp.]
MLIDLLLVLAGIGVLTAGGEALIRGALALAQRLRISPLLTGLVIVGFGTSAPELVVSIDAALLGKPDIALGNVIGSNIGNILLILGICALLRPMPVTALALGRDATSGLAASILFLVLAAGAALGRIDGVILLTGLVVYLGWAYWSERGPEQATARLHEAESQAFGRMPRSWWFILSGSVGGLVLLVAGSRILLLGAVGLARDLGVSEALIGLTLVAVGTSLPELSVAVIATLRRQADVAVGNILGSNLFNLLCILGISALLQPLPMPHRMVVFDQWVLLGASAAVLVMLWTGRRLSRVEGTVFLVAYGVFLLVGFRAFPS